MRRLILSAPLCLALGTAALAQAPMPPATAQQPPVAPPAMAAAPAAGTGLSEPMSRAAANIDTQDEAYPRIAPNLPSPALGNNASPADYLRAAEGALAAGRTGEAQEALEMAETRLLDRSVAYSATNQPSRNPAVDQISQALQALAAGDRARCMQLIAAAIPAAEAR